MSALAVLDPIQASISSLLPSGGLVVSMQASFDDSGNSDKSLMVVAGFFFRDSALTSFSAEWRHALNGLPFHMKDLVHGHGAFRSLDKEQRASLSIELIATIKRHATLGVAMSLEQGAYVEYLNRHPEVRDVVGSSYAMCSLLCLSAAARWMDETGAPPEETVYFFESGNSKQADANQFLTRMVKHPLVDKRYQYVSHSFVKKNKLPSLDAADLLGWEWTQECRRIMGLETRPTRKSLQALAEVPLLAHHFKKEETVFAFVQTMLEPYVTPTYGARFIHPNEEFPE